MISKTKLSRLDLKDASFIVDEDANLLGVNIGGKDYFIGFDNPINSGLILDGNEDGTANEIRLEQDQLFYYYNFDGEQISATPKVIDGIYDALNDAVGVDNQIILKDFKISSINYPRVSVSAYNNSTLDGTLYLKVELIDNDGSISSIDYTLIVTPDDEVSIAEI